jgi:hypothetical protein
VSCIATRSGVPFRIKFHAAVRRQSCRRRPGNPANLHAFAHAFRQSIRGSPSRWNTNNESSRLAAIRRCSTSFEGSDSGSTLPAFIFSRSGSNLITPPAMSISRQVSPVISPRVLGLLEETLTWRAFLEAVRERRHHGQQARLDGDPKRPREAGRLAIDRCR